MNKPSCTIVQAHVKNFESLQSAFRNDQVMLMDCIERKTGEHVAVICAVSQVNGEYQFVPFARFFNGNPYEDLISPMESEYHHE